MSCLVLGGHIVFESQPIPCTSHVRLPLINMNAGQERVFIISCLSTDSPRTASFSRRHNQAAVSAEAREVTNESIRQDPNSFARSWSLIHGMNHGVWISSKLIQKLAKNKEKLGTRKAKERFGLMSWRYPYFMYFHTMSHTAILWLVS